MKIRIELDLSDEDFKLLWQYGVPGLVREDPQKGYTPEEKKKAARLAGVTLIDNWLREHWSKKNDDLPKGISSDY